MNAVLVSIITLAAGFIILSYSADRLLAVAATLAKQCGVSMLFIGITVIAFGTSAPELIVSAMAALNGAEGLAVGNGLGSNIINIGLVLGCCALMAPLSVHQNYLYRQFPFLLLAVLLCAGLMKNQVLSFFDALILLAGLCAYGVYLANMMSKQQQDISEEVDILDMNKHRAILETLMMLVLLLVGANMMVHGGVGVARGLGIDELTIGLTVVAFGTSLPELAAALAAVRRGHHDIAFATVIGSNLFNILGVIALPGLLGDGLQVSEQVLQRDIPAMVILTLALGVSFYWPLLRQRKQARAKTKVVMHRKSGYLLLGLFSGYGLILLSPL
ncbi:calcium/sodium antiporter [Motilimonas pumila]|uniref:Sodium:calcium antiporter n=1 Tax=Motilimonas pumila TaxID=2303987 RepID=A0A418YEF0_9GAMM|nr:calcium/sodium antiporter [Motilimonas pumila]RJG47452.1 sodium:calcium antiporter [Motilimonas pumila]